MEELMEAILAVFPDASLGQDNDGQIIVYTNLKEVVSIADGSLSYIDMDTEDVWNAR